MNSKEIFIKTLQLAVFCAVMYVAIQVAVALGIEEKPWWKMFGEFIVGGTFGAVAGLTFFVVFGAVGWVCGPLFGSIGLVTLMLGGALGGLGLGALVNILRNPDGYIYHWLIIVPVLVVGVLVAKFLSTQVGRFAKRAQSPDLTKRPSDHERSPT